MLINSFHATGLFLYPWKRQKYQRFSNTFKGFRKGPVEWNGFIPFLSFPKISHFLILGGSPTFLTLPSLYLFHTNYDASKALFYSPFANIYNFFEFHTNKPAINFKIPSKNTSYHKACARMTFINTAVPIYLYMFYSCDSYCV